MPVKIVELLEQATPRFARRAHSAAPCLAVEKRPAQGTLLWAALPRERLAQREQRSAPLAPAFFAPGR